jgi:NAD(P)-dependent dehydrogenase (short-subunit alcohol dehydrogenase family)
MTEGLDGRVAVVTGGGGAIGAALCSELTRAGASVVVADVDGERAEAAAAAARALGSSSVAHIGDLTRTGEIERLIASAERRFGGVDILVNGAGDHLGSSGPFENSTEESWRALHDVNLLHVFRACRAVLPGMKERGFGRIVNFSSVEGIRAAPSLAVYAAYKAAIDAFTKSLAVDVARHGIRVNAIAVDKTRAFQVDHYQLPPEYERLVDTWIPAGRYGEPEEVARIAMFLIGDQSSWIVGQTVVADGGTTAAGGWYRTPARWTNQPLLIQYHEDPSANHDRPPTVQ